MFKMESRNDELQKQNTILHEQIQTISSKMADNLQHAANESPLNISLTEEGKSQDQLLEILRWSMLFFFWTKAFLQMKSILMNWYNTSKLNKDKS